jgi:NAD(P)-dependent dehydrogenase (short-subunit alcohol dehydrogenase family)
MSLALGKKTAIVTGAGSGIGRSIAELFAKEGANVVVSDINETAGNETVAIVKKAGGKAIFVKADTGSASDNEALVARAVKEYGGLHVSVNNAGIGGASAPVGEYPIDSWDKTIAINLSGVFYGMRYQIPAMLKSGNGSVINMASVLGQVGFATSSAYVAAKHGVVGLTKSAALEYGEKNVRVNAIGPGFIHTPLIDKNLNADAQKFIAGKHAMARLGKPEEIAELALWLASDKASFVTGAYYAADGGYLAQ